MEGIKGWELCDWESFPKTKIGHDALIKKLKYIIVTKYHLKLVNFNEEEAHIAIRHGRKPHYYTAHKPDLIITKEEKPENRIFIEYVNTNNSFLRDLRGMITLSTVVKSSRGFVLAIRHSIYKKYSLTGLQKDRPVELMSLKSILHSLDVGDLDWLVGIVKSTHVR